MKTRSTKTSGERLSAEERREAILDAAVVEFAAFGLHGGSTERIAAQVGISQPYIFRLFGTKKELFMAAADRVADLIKSVFQASVAADPANPLGAVADAFVQLMHRHDELVLVMQGFAASKDPDMLAIGRARLAELYEYVAQVSGASDDELQEIFAYGMLLIVAASLDLPAIAPQQRWAANLIRRRM